MNGEVKRKRGRPPKVRSENRSSSQDGFNSNPITTLDEIQICQDVFKNVMKVSKLKPFLKKPENHLFGMSNYSTIIENPMWLGEIERKFVNNEYKNGREFIDDMKLMLKNCYRYWGYYHKFTRMGLQLEKKLFFELKTLPQCVKDRLGLESEERGVDQATLNLDHWGSRILEEMSREEPSEKSSEESTTEQELLLWQKEVLLNSRTNIKYINTSWLLAEIGLFLRLSGVSLELEELTQFELERMLLMPRESNSLATIMTSMLCPYSLRGNLYLRPVMSYQVWTHFLKKKVDSWYNVYYKFIDPIEVGTKCGVEADCWAGMGEVNPLTFHQFHELSFPQRAWILKALCSYTFHSNKRVEDSFNKFYESDLRAVKLGKDHGHEYITLFSPEIRVYKQKIINDPDEELLLSGFHNLVPRKGESFDVNGEYDKILDKYQSSHMNCKEFSVVASSVESLEELCNNLKNRKDLLSELRKIPTEQHKEVTMAALSSMYNQWTQFRQREESLERSVGYWLSVNGSAAGWTESYLEKMTPFQPTVVSPPNITSEPISGKRVQKKRIVESYEMTDVEDVAEIDSSAGDETSSDWETNTTRKKSKRKKKSPSWIQFGDNYSQMKKKMTECGLVVRRCPPGIRISRTLQGKPSFLSSLIRQNTQSSLPSPVTPHVLTISIGSGMGGVKREDGESWKGSGIREETNSTLLQHEIPQPRYERLFDVSNVRFDPPPSLQIPSHQILPFK